MVESSSHNSSILWFVLAKGFY